MRGLKGLENATLQWNSSVNIKGQSFQRVNALVRESADVYKQTALSINKTTGEVYALDKGLKTKSNTMNNVIERAAIANDIDKRKKNR